jgi:hypothetical protein
MEKYSQFSFQGVNPFITSFEKIPIAALILRVAVAVLKAPFLAPAAAFLLFASAVSAALPPTIRWWWCAIVVRAASRLLLYVLGVWTISTSVLDKHRVRSRPSPSAPPHDIRRGDILIANHSSWLDVLVLSALFAPQFTRTSQTGGMRRCTVVEAMLASLKPLPQKLGPASADSVHLFVTDNASGGLGPLAVFPEGSTSNNKAVLAFAPVAQQLCDATLRLAEKRRPVVHVLAIQYAAESAALGSPAPFVAGNAWVHAALLLGCVYTPVSVLRLPRGHDPQPADFPGVSVAQGVPSATVPPSSAKTGDDKPLTWAQTTQQLLSQLLVGARAVPVGAAEHAQFVQYYEQWSGGLKQQKSAKAV